MKWPLTRSMRALAVIAASAGVILVAAFVYLVRPVSAR